MPAVTITLGKRSFQMGCAAGEEGRLQAIAERVNTHLAELEAQVGTTNETVLLAMTCLMLQDELDEAQKNTPTEAQESAASSQNNASHEADMVEALDAVSEYVETITKRIQTL